MVAYHWYLYHYIRDRRQCLYISIIEKERLKQQLPLSDTLVDATLDPTDLPYENINIYQTEQTAFEFQEQGLPRNIKVKATTKDNQSIVQFDWQKADRIKPLILFFLIMTN